MIEFKSTYLLGNKARQIVLVDQSCCYQDT